MVTAVLLPLAALTALGKSVLALVAGTFILWALITAISIPKRNPTFPRNLGMYITITAVLFAGQMAAVVWATGTQEVEEAVHEPGGGGEEAPTPTEPEGDAKAGEDLFAANGCGSCHTLAAAGAAGTIGPNLDQSKPARELVIDRVTNGKGAMPAFGDKLDAKQIGDIAAFVVSATGGGETPTAEEPPAAGEPPAGESAAGGSGSESTPLGKEVFASAGCGTCHTLADAGTTGTVGPNLDESKPSVELVVDRVTNGRGAMPAFKGSLDESQIQEVAAYVAAAAGS